MAEKGRELLRSVYDVAPARRSRSSLTAFPTLRLSSRTRRRPSWASAGRSVILTFGLLSPNKGIEVMIDAMPSILKTPRRCRLCRARRDASQSGARRRRGLSRKPDGARARARRRGPCRVPRPVRRPGDAARFHFDVRCLCDALSQRSADDVGHAGLQLRAGKGGGLDALLARARTAGRRARRAGSVWRRRGDRRAKSRTC